MISGAPAVAFMVSDEVRTFHYIIFEPACDI